MSDKPCVFCEIVAGRAPATVVAEWPDALALVPLTPVVDGHVLVIPKEHVNDALQSSQLTAAVMNRAVMFAFTNSERYESCNIQTSVDAAATQSIRHLHLHVVPRTVDDGLMLPWGTIYGDDPAAPHLCQKLKQVAELHISRDGNPYPECEPYFRCVEDGEEWPCATAKALGADR